MSHILTSQPRTPVTATYIILGTSIAYVRLWGITSNLLTDILVISVIGGIISSLFYYVEPLQRVGNYLLRRKYNTTIGKQFPMYQEVNYQLTFVEPYFENDRNKIYGSMYLFASIIIALADSPIPYSLIPLELFIGAILGCVFLLGVGYGLIPKQWDRIRKVHYVLVLERYSKGDTRDIADKVKGNLIANRWLSAMNFINQSIEDFYERIKRFSKDLSKQKDNWRNANIKHSDIQHKFSSGFFDRGSGIYRKLIEDTRIWLYALDMQVYKLNCTVDKLIDFLQLKKDELLSVLDDELILRLLETSGKDVSHFYSETFKPTPERINRLHKAIVSDIKKGPSPRSIPNVDEVIKTIERIKGLKLIITPIIEKIEDVEMCVKEIIR